MMVGRCGSCGMGGCGYGGFFFFGVVVVDLVGGWWQ